MRYLSRFASSLLVSILVAGSACQPAQARSNPGNSNNSTAQSKPSSLLPLPSPALAKAGTNASSIADVVDRVLPSVVSISSTRVSRNRAPSDDPFFRFFFGPQQGEREKKEQGLGSGVIVGNGIVITNNHVVEGADEIKVTTLNHRDFVAELVGTDPKSDIAVLRIKDAKKELKPLALGDSARLRLGDVVLAIGNPFGVGQTVTMGIVSAKGRSDLGIVDYEDFIQTDAAINPGNSGGALVDMEGNLVGINTAILSRSGGSMGIGFAIPTNMVRPIVDSLISQGKVVRGWLGVTIQTLDPDLAQGLGVNADSGIVVSDTAKGSPAEKAGLKRDDVIVAVDGKAVTTTGELRNAIAVAGANRTVNLKIIRNGKELTLPCALTASPDQNDSEASNNGKLDAKTDDVIGMRVEPLSSELRQKLEVPSQVENGVVITGLSPNSAGARAGLRPGDILVKMNKQPLSTSDDVVRIYKNTKGALATLVWRRGAMTYVVIKRD
jgi:serine protease Do